jgi:hypothetical protein
VQVPGPLHSLLQNLQPCIAHEPAPVQDIEQPPPPHANVIAPEPLLVALHLPALHLKLHAPAPRHSKAQPAPSQVRMQAPTPSQTQAFPALQLVGFLSLPA